MKNEIEEITTMENGFTQLISLPMLLQMDAVEI